MGGHQKDQAIGRPEMDASHKTAIANIVREIVYGLIGSRRPVVKGQHDAAGRGDKEEEEGCSAEIAN